MSSTPRHPGQILSEDYLIPLGMSHYDAAKRLYAAEATIDRLVAGKEKITWNLSKRLASVFDQNQSFWLDAQRRWDRYQAEILAIGTQENTKPS